MGTAVPRVLLTDGDYDNALAVARELSEDLNATVIGAGTSRHSRLLRSRYCDVGVTVPDSEAPGYAEALLAAVDEYRPHTILPIGHASVAELVAARGSLPDSVTPCLPPPESFRAAEDKATTLRYGERVGFDVPADYSELVADLDVDGRSLADLDALPFPIFLKARWETGRATTALVDDPANFWETYDLIAADAPNGDVLVQEYVDGPGATYGCGLLFLDNEVELMVGHEELRSVPRHGGSGTHLRLHRDPHLEAGSIRLLGEIGWHGIALVEFRRRPDGSLVLMEINPKFWASYAIASAYGYRFATTIVANILDLDVDPPVGSPEPVGEMVFPLRELYYYLQNREGERLHDCLASVARPRAAWDLDWRDLPAWLTPPAALVRKFPYLDSPDVASVAPRDDGDERVGDPGVQVERGSQGGQEERGERGSRGERTDRVCRE